GVTTVTGAAGSVATNLIKGGATYTLDNATANKGSDGTVTWTSFGALNAGTSVAFGTAGSVSGNVTSPNLDYTNYATAVTYDIANGANQTTGITGTHTGVTTVTGAAGSVATNLIKGGATYTLDNATANKGSDGTVTWTSFGALNAGTSVAFGTAGSVSGNVTSPNLDYTNYATAVTYDIANGANQTTGITGTHTGVTTVTGAAGSVATNLIKGGATYTLDNATANKGSDGT